MHKRFIFFSILLLCLGQNLPTYCLADDLVDDNPTPKYLWGRGLTFPQLNLTLGGYANINYKRFEHKSDVLVIDDLSLFITWTPHARFRFFSEIELEDLISTDGIAKSGHTLSLERLYLDFLANETVTVRFGKFLTPVGLWNVIHAAPLVWTSTRPLITESQLFASHASGAMITKSFFFSEQDLDISLYFDDSKDLDPLPDNEVFKNAFGVRLNYQLFDYLHFGASYLGFKKHADQALARNHLFGLDFLWKKDQYEIQMEFAYRLADDIQKHETGFYLQGIAPLGHQVFAVGRYEFFDGTHQLDNIISDSTINLGVAGVAWRPFVPLVFKAEYRFGSNDMNIAPNGFFTSVALFF